MAALYLCALPCLLRPQAARAAVQDLSLECICGPEGGFLAAASPTLCSLHMGGLPDFKACCLLLHKRQLPLNLAALGLL